MEPLATLPGTTAYLPTPMFDVRTFHAQYAEFDVQPIPSSHPLEQGSPSVSRPQAAPSFIDVLGMSFLSICYIRLLSFRHRGGRHHIQTLLYPTCTLSMSPIV